MTEQGFLLNALTQTYEQIWKPNIDEERHQIMILVLNHRIDQSSRLCSEIQTNYLNQGIEVIIIAIGAAYAQYLSPDTQFNCLENDLNIEIMGSLIAISNDFYTHFTTMEVCDANTKLTEFDGSYRYAATFIFVFKTIFQFNLRKLTNISQAKLSPKKVL